MSSLAIIIPTHNRNELLQRTLRSLGECHPPVCPVELVVVENGGRFGAEKAIPKLPNWLNGRYEYCEAGNKSTALNQVLSSLKPTWILLFDDDVRFDRQNIAAYAEAINGRQGGVYFGGPVGVDYEQPPDEWVWLPPSARGWRLETAGECPESPYFLGANWAVYSEDVRRLGGFDQNFGPGSQSGMRGQESNMQRRLHESGVVPIYVPDALVWHYVPKDRCSTEWSLKRAYQHATAAGMDFDPGTNQVPTLFGLPRWCIRQVASCYLAVVRKRIAGDNCSLYQAKLEYKRALGYLHGAQIATRQHKNNKVPVNAINSRKASR